ncbi:ATP-grasp domain-containing protein [Mycolicibacterium sp. Dal123E01]|uniref:ATP-grasp domain-containing protein n=1 Tax=Mycolicibacterium sp. Dal123E01 TaxID=3457578 RepID=UPI00403EC402
MSPPPNLARPDVFHPSIVLAGCPQLVSGDGDDDGLVEALRRRGLHARWLSWDDPQTETADLVILRAAWDYAERREEFLAWTTRVRNLLNAPPVVAWNSDKHYLQDLAEAGVPTLTASFFEPGDTVTLPKGEIVVKPAIGAGSIDTGRFVDHAAARAHIGALQDAGRTALVQPYDARVEQGETALVFLGGRQSHAFTKGPMLPPEGEATLLDESGTYVAEKLTSADPDFAMWDVGVAALAAACGHLGIETTELLYARVDLIGGPDNPVLLELEVIEPGLGWGQLDQATRETQQRTFALEVESACERLGLGPLSHRRP